MFKMNKASAAVIALAMAAGTASAQDASNVAGYLSLGASSTNGVNSWDSDYNPWRGLDIAAGASFALSGGNSVDLEFSSMQAGDAYYDGYYVTHSTLAAAGYNMTFGALTFGGFAGALVQNDYYEEGDDTNLIIGAKTAFAAADNVTVNAQLGTISQQSGYNDMGRVNFGSIAATFEATDALHLTASVGALNGQVGDTGDETATARSYALEAAYQINNGPTEVYAKISGFDTGDASWGSSQTVGVGLKINLGGKSMAAGKVMDLSPLAWMRETGSW